MDEDNIEEEEEEESGQEGNSEPDEPNIEALFSTDQSDKSEAYVETDADSLPTVVIEEMDISSDAIPLNPYMNATEVHEPLIVPQTAHLLGNEEGVRSEQVAYEDEAATRPVSEPWIIQKIAPLLGSELPIERSWNTGNQYRESPPEFNQNTGRDRKGWCFLKQNNRGIMLRLKF